MPPPTPPPLVPCTTTPLSGLWRPGPRTPQVFYGPNCVESHLLDALPSPDRSRVFIITGATLDTRTPLIRRVEALLGPNRHVGSFAGIRQHGPEADVDEAFRLVSAAAATTTAGGRNVDTLIAVGGGSPIDSAKVVAYRLHQARKNQKSGHPGGVPSFSAPGPDPDFESTAFGIRIIAIPTTLSAAECTPGGGYTRPNGIKLGFMAASMSVGTVFYDPRFARATPRALLLATGVRALDHAVETCYHPLAAEVPWKALAGWAARVLFEELPRVARLMERTGYYHDDAKGNGGDDDGNLSTAAGRGCGSEAAEAFEVEVDNTLTRLMLAAFASSGFRGLNFSGGMGLSHALGHALGSPYDIPHGETSCLTLAPVIRLKASRSDDDARQIGRLLLSAAGKTPSYDSWRDAMQFADEVDGLVMRLGLGSGSTGKVSRSSLADRGVGRDQVPVIVSRALRGVSDEGLKEAVTALVEGLF